MASVNIKPLEDKILVQANEAETTTASGLVIPDTAKEKPQEGTVVAVGPGRWDDEGEKRIPLDVSEGDTVAEGDLVVVLEAMKMEQPLNAHRAGVIKGLSVEAGQTVASGDTLCEIVDEDKMDMARVPELARFAEEHGLLFISIADLIRYRRRTEKLVRRVAEARIPTRWGDFTSYVFESVLDGEQHVAMVKGSATRRTNFSVRRR